ncbi:MAG: dTDP-4-dehydrorhamnose 3,5-epimerase family protein, partial [Pseudomonadota bacterium]|nr:dTDP-4-dehydrorhamnose 3,5-epimerase family protein [Pseudomonadota bacterium]
TAYYNAAGEGGIRFDDLALNIPWPVKQPIVSDRDRNLQHWKDYAANPPLWGRA